MGKKLKPGKAVTLKIKFLQAGKWSDNPKDPTIEVEKGDVKVFSERVALLAIYAGKAVIYEEPKEVPPPPPSEGDVPPPPPPPPPPQIDKANAQSNKPKSGKSSKK